MPTHPSHAARGQEAAWAELSLPTAWLGAEQLQAQPASAAGELHPGLAVRRQLLASKEPEAAGESAQASLPRGGTAQSCCWHTCICCFSSGPPCAKPFAVHCSAKVWAGAGWTDLAEGTALASASSQSQLPASKGQCGSAADSSSTVGCTQGGVLRANPKQGREQPAGSHPVGFPLCFHCCFSCQSVSRSPLSFPSCEWHLPH